MIQSIHHYPLYKNDKYSDAADSYANKLHTNP